MSLGCLLLWFASAVTSAGATPAPAPRPSPVALTTSDGAKLAGEAWGRGAKGVLLVHDAGRTHADWATLAARLAASGFEVLAIDLRGHGASKLDPPLAEADYPKLVEDVNAGVAWLVGKGATEIHLVGERLGANLVLQAAPASAQVRDVVLVSPALNSHGVKVSTGVTGLGDRSVLVVAGADDPMAVKASAWVVAQIGPTAKSETFPGATGTRLVNTAPEVANLIVTWVDGGFRGPAEVAAAPAGGAQLKSGDVNDIETTGTRLEDRKR